MSAIARRSLVDQVYSIILGRIQRGELKPGDRINIEDYSKEFGVSRTPMREAINRLTENGLVISKHNVGPSVAELDSDKILEIIEANSVMMNTIAPLIFKKTDRIELADELDAVIESQEAALKANDQQKFFEASVDFHEKIINACPNTILAEMTMKTQIQLDAFILSYLEWDNKKEASIVDHSALTKYLREGNLEAYCSKMEEHNMTPVQFLIKED